MAVIIGNLHPQHSGIKLSRQPLKWLMAQFDALFGLTRRNPSPFPDRVWSHHSALLDAAWKRSRNKQAG